MGMDRSAATITVISGGYQVVSSLGTDQLFGVEFIQFDDQLLDLSTISSAPTSGADVLAGTASADVIDLLAGNDSYDGLGGNDTITGGAGSDTLNGGDDHDILRLWTSAAGELDVLNGDNGQDAADFSGFGAAVWVDLTYGGVEAWTKDDGNARTSGPWRSIADLNGIENITGTAYDDLLAGDAQANILSGNAGHDELRGGGGNDTITGGAGNDTLNGGVGNDRFVFNDGHGIDRINDFEALNDSELIDLSGISAITSFSDLRDNHMSIQNGILVIDTGSGQISLIGVTLSDLLDGNDFVF